MILYHGTTLRAANSILKNGVKMHKSCGGYFGDGFYTSEDIELIKTNYDHGAILQIDINSSYVNYLDPASFEKWKLISKETYKKRFYRLAIKNGFHAIHDNSFEGIVIYNKKIIRSIKLFENGKQTIIARSKRLV